jgi:hypothetical protein
MSRKTKARRRARKARAIESYEVARRRSSEVEPPLSREELTLRIQRKFSCLRFRNFTLRIEWSRSGSSGEPARLAPASVQMGTSP